MSDPPLVRMVERDELDRVRELARSSLTASYALSPDDIEAIVEAEFTVDTLRERAKTAEVGPFVAEVDDVLAGFAEVSTDGDEGTIRWLHVDPERRGRGVGTALFGRAVSELDDRDVRAVTLASNTAAGAFFERLGFERVGERPAEIDGIETVEYVYATADGGDRANSATGVSETGDSESTARDAVDLPDEVSTGDGRTVYTGGDPIAGSEGWFAVTFADGDRTEAYGYYCANCGSTDVSAGSMDRLRCGDCGNTHTPDEDYDDSYL